MSNSDDIVDLETQDFGTTLAGLAGFVLLFVFGGFWLHNTDLSGAIIIPGKVDIMGGAKTVQHRDGGVVSSILVEPGETVRKGQPLIELDVVEHKIRANATTEKLKHLAARLYRLNAERKQALAEDVFDLTPKKISFQPSNSSSLTIEAELMRTRKAHLHIKQERGELKIEQLQTRINGLEQEAMTKQEELKLLVKELDARKKLFDRGFSSLAALRQSQMKITIVRGAIVKLMTERGALTRQVAEIEATSRNDKIAFQESVISEIISVESEARELKRSLMTDKTLINRASIKAPSSGTVHKMEVFTVGGVINPSQELMRIVPDDAPLEISASLETKYIDDVTIDQKAVVMLSGLDIRTTPELNAVVRWISPDVVTDPNTGVPHYKIRVTVSPEEIKKLNAEKLVPGMPADIYINTGERTAYEYLTEPLIGQLRKAFRE